MQIYQKTKDLPREFRSYLFNKPSVFASQNRKFLYKLVQIWRNTASNEIAMNYIDEMNLIRCLTWNDYKSFNRYFIEDIEKKYNILSNKTQ